LQFINFIFKNEHLKKELEKIEGEFGQNKFEIKKIEFMNFHHAFVSNFHFQFF
jgi:hypothetical protein